MKKPSLILIILLSLSQSQCTKGIIIDSALAANLAGDKTALIRLSGCGPQPFVSEGFSYCRVAEGPMNDAAIELIAPPQATNCDETACVSFKIYFPDTAQAPYEDVIQKGQVSKKITWKQLTGRENFTAGDRGWWPYTYSISWKDGQGMAHKTVSEGEIRLRVYRTLQCDNSGAACKSYSPLRNAPNAKEYAWSWVADGQEIKMTTSGRTYVAPIAGSNQYPEGTR